MRERSTLGREISDAFISLVFAIEAHESGYIDSCYVPQSRRPSVIKRPLSEIAVDCSDLRERVAAAVEVGAVRTSYLSSQLSAIAGRLEMMQKPRGSMVAEARVLFDIEPAWIAEESFLDDRALLDDQLPGTGSIHQRLDGFRLRARVPFNPESGLFRNIVSTLRMLTQREFGIPGHDRLAITFHSDRPSHGYHRYFGRFRSSVEINSARVLDIPGVIHLLAHEAYPGHHTELVLKEVNLTRGRGWMEHSLTILDAPSCVVSEGIATRALSALMSEDDLVQWCSELLPAVGLHATEAYPRVAIENALQRLKGVATNAALMLDEGRTDDDVARYVRVFGLIDDCEARRLIRFIRSVRAYVFVYYSGGRLLDALFASRENPKMEFLRLLREPVTPHQIRGELGR